MAGNRVPFVTALPTNTPMVDEIIFDTQLQNVYWRFAWDPPSSWWRFIGGPPLVARVDTAETRTAGAGYGALATAGPSITLPLAGDYLVQCGANMFAGAAFGANMSYDVGGTGAIDADAASFTSSPAAIQGIQGAGPLHTKTGLAISTALVSKYKCTTTNTNFGTRWISALPIRCQ